MSSSSQMQLLFLLHLIIFIFIAVSAAAPTQQLNLWALQCQDAYGNYTSNSTYKSNLDKLLTNISTTNIPYGFYNFSAGEDSDQVNAIALCRGDLVNVSDCHTCLRLLISNLTDSCPNQMEAIGYAEKCMLRYSTRNILGGDWSTRPSYNLVTGIDVVGDEYLFANVVEELLRSLPNKTAAGDSRLKFATGEANVSASQKVYAMMQCTPDLPPTDCLGCLYWAMYDVIHSDRGQTGARVLLPSCFIRYESQKFYVSPPSESAAHPSSPARSAKGHVDSEMVVITVVVGALACLFLLVIFVVCWVRRARTTRRRVSVKLGDSQRDKVIDFEPNLQQDFSIIRDATDNFSRANELGHGSFGVVYKGTLASRQEIAVKRLEGPRRESIRPSDEEFKNEVRIAAKLQHANLAELLGFCLEGEERLLIFEYLSNGSLDKVLFNERRRGELDWKKRFIIIEGIAQGLLYLHQHSRERIIHRDLKPDNVLLDEALKPKITDFGTARLFPANLTHATTKSVKGTPGYYAPEYPAQLIVSFRLDVYSFGILVLELVAGRRNVILRNPDPGTWLIVMVWKHWIDGTTSQIIDSTIASSPEMESEIKRCIHIALLCVQENADSRPNMSRVLHMLTCQTSSLENPTPPPFVQNSRDSSQSKSSVSSGSAKDLYPRRQGSMIST